MNNFPMPKPGDEMDLTIDTLAFGGEGIGRVTIHDKPFTVFVEETVPGDEVKVRLAKRKKNWGQGFVKALNKPSDLRIQPRCRHFGSIKNYKLPIINDGRTMSDSSSWSRSVTDPSKGCGGCAWQFLSYENQLLYKEKQVREAIKHIGGIDEQVVLPIIGMKDPWFYRNKMEFSFSRTREGEITLGLHMRGRHYDVTELTECFLLEPYAGEFVAGAREFFRAMDQERKIDSSILLQSLTLRVAKNTGETMVILSAEVGDSAHAPESAASTKKSGSLEIFLNEFQAWVTTFFATKKIPLTSLLFIEILNKAGQRKTFTEKLLAGKATIIEELRLGDGASLQFQISPQAFFQPNTFQAETLYQKALEAAELTGSEVVYDLFCGTGTIGIFCSKQAQKVYGIELNPSSIDNARINAELNNIKNTEFFVGDVGKNLPRLPEKPDVIIVDPPRNGLEPKVVEQILKFAPRSIVYVSCNPSTLARDLKLLCAEKYRLKSVQPVDMFPQTYHIENVARLELIS